MMIHCEDHPDNEGTCVYCMNEVIAQRDDRERAWHLAESRIRDMARLLAALDAHARRLHDREIDSPALERDWQSVQERVREVLAEEEVG